MLFQKLRTILCEWMLRRKISRNKRKRFFYNLNRADSVGLIFDASHQDSYMTTRKFVEILRNKGKTVRAIGYVTNKKALEYFDEHRDISFFWVNDCSLFCKPKNKDVVDFTQKNFDIFIDLTKAEMVQTRFIVGISEAKLKIGRDLFYKNIYDFILRIPDEKKLSYYIEQVVHYLTQIDTKRAVA